MVGNPIFRSILVLSLMFLIILPALPKRGDYIGSIVDEIRFEGLINVSPDELKGILLLQPGSIIDEFALNEDIKVLFDTGYFSNVIMKAKKSGEGRSIITFIVTELPHVDDIEFLGVEELYPADLRAALPFKEGGVYSRQKVLDGVISLKQKYRSEGYFLVEVWQRISELDPKTNTVDITYIIDEGEDIPVAKINVLGTRHLDPNDILDVLDQKEEGSFEDGIFHDSAFEEDKQKIVAYAKSKGFLDAEIDEESTGYEIRWRNPTRRDQGRVVVETYKVKEGDIYYFGGYSLEHDKNALNEEFNPPERRRIKPDDLRPIYRPEGLLDLMEFSNYNTGDVFDETKFFRDRGLIQELYSRRGYVFTQVQPSFVTYELSYKVLDKYEKCLATEEPVTERDEMCKREAQWIDLNAARERLDEYPEMEGRVLRHAHFVIRENSLAYIENIIIKGMVKTQENVIRRELLIREGQLFNSALVNRSREKLINLGYFKEVNLQMRPGSDDSKMNLIIDVVEQPTGTVSMGGGYGTASGFSIFVEGGETNLNGNGERISGKLQYGPELKSIGFSWTDPWFFESCETGTGNFWRNKIKDFDTAGSIEEINQIADSLQNNYRKYRETIRAYTRRAEGDNSIETLDRIKVNIRNLLHDMILSEYDCYKSAPRPWAFSVSIFFSNYQISNSSSNTIAVSRDPYDLFEGSTYDVTSVGLGFGTSHSFLINWAHYHRYSPSWSIASNPSSLVDNNILKRTKLGWQFKSSLTHGLIYNNLDNIFTPTSGIKVDMSMENVGQLLGGDDHYNRYNLTMDTYWWWFDYTFGGVFRKNSLRQWRVVQEFRVSATFTHETVPYGKTQNKDINPYIESNDRLYLGGYESLRGYSWSDFNYPLPWRDGGNHMLLYSTELRFPIEPSVIWFVTFLDAGALYDEISEYTGDDQEYVDTYNERRYATAESLDPIEYYISENYNSRNWKKNFYGSEMDWNDPRKSVLSMRNVSLERTMFSWGVGIRIQIPVLPLRLYWAQKLYWHKGGFKPIPGDDKFEFVFGIGDFRF